MVPSVASSIPFAQYFSRHVINYRLVSCFVRSNHRTILAVCKHIIAKEALAGATVGIRVEEALDDGVIISALEVVEARLFDCGLSLRSIWDGFLIVKLRVNVPAPGGQMPSRTY